jgi:uroporphyrinogen III methyltransferase/synthase
MNALVSRRVVVTRSAAQSGEICGLLQAAGAVPVLVPTITIAPPASFERLDRALRSVAEYDWLVLTSANGARSVLQRTATLGLDLSRMTNLRLAAVGPATRAVLSDAGLTVAATPSDHRGDQIPGSLGDVDGLRILLPRSDLADDELPASLRDKGAGVDAVTAYRTTTKAMTAVGLEALDEGVDAITFTSPSTIRGLVEGLGVARARVIQEAVVASIGPVTSEAARALGVRVDVEASESSARGLVEALSTYEGWVHHASSTAP